MAFGSTLSFNIFGSLSAIEEEEKQVGYTLSYLLKAQVKAKDEF